MFNTSKLLLTKNREHLCTPKSSLDAGGHHKHANLKPLLTQIPLDIRLIIYDFLLSTRPAPDWQWDEHSSLQHSHPLYPLLFVNRFLKREISDIVYTSGTLHFGTPKRCLAFLKWTHEHIHLLRGLHVLVPGHDTYSLEAVFELLVREKVPLEALKIEILTIDTPGLPIPKNRYLDQDVSREALHQSELRLDQLRSGSTSNDDLSPYSPLNLTSSSSLHRAQSSTHSYLDQLTSIRYISILHLPRWGPWINEFRLGFLNLQIGMYDLAKKEGKSVVVRKVENITRDILWDERKGCWVEVEVRDNAGRYHGWDDEREIFVEGSESVFSSGKERGEVEMEWFMGRICLEFLPPKKFYGRKTQKFVDCAKRVEGWFAAVPIPFSR